MREFHVSIRIDLGKCVRGQFVHVTILIAKSPTNCRGQEKM